MPRPRPACTPASAPTVSLRARSATPRLNWAIAFAGCNIKLRRVASMLPVEVAGHEREPSDTEMYLVVRRLLRGRKPVLSQSIIGPVEPGELVRQPRVAHLIGESTLQRGEPTCRLIWVALDVDQDGIGKGWDIVLPQLPDCCEHSVELLRSLAEGLEQTVDELATVLAERADMRRKSLPRLVDLQTFKRRTGPVSNLLPLVIVCWRRVKRKRQQRRDALVSISSVQPARRRIANAIEILIGKEWADAFDERGGHGRVAGPQSGVQACFDSAATFVTQQLVPRAGSPPRRDRSSGFRRSGRRRRGSREKSPGRQRAGAPFRRTATGFPPWTARLPATRK